MNFTFAHIVATALILTLFLGDCGGCISTSRLWAKDNRPPATPRAETPAERGLRLLLTKPYLTPDFDQEVFDNLWQVWPRELKQQAENADPAQRRRMTFSRYGLMERPGADAPGRALGYVDDKTDNWTMNCLACHTGKVAGQVIVGAPNSHTALQTLTEEVRLVKFQRQKQLGHLDLGSLKIPLNTTNGTTNAVIFGVALGALRTPDLDVRKDAPPPVLLHHDMDAPPFWNVKYKTHLYADGFAGKSHRPLMQFVMLPRNSAQTLRNWEPDFKDILAWIESLEPPRYPGPIDAPLARQGKNLFERHCAECHGTYGDKPDYPNRIVPLDTVQTDPVRLQSLTKEYRQFLRDSWFGDYGKSNYVLEPKGYLAPPLHGIWASAPYLHNGSVPTLWHLLHPAARPVVWKRSEDGYDHQRMGLDVQTWGELPSPKPMFAERRTYFDTRLKGKSAAGHTFPDRLTAPEKQAVLEYLKTL